MRKKVQKNVCMCPPIVCIPWKKSITLTHPNPTHTLTFKKTLPPIICTYGIIHTNQAQPLVKALYLLDRLNLSQNAHHFFFICKYQDLEDQLLPQGIKKSCCLVPILLKEMGGYIFTVNLDKSLCLSFSCHMMIAIEIQISISERSSGWAISQSLCGIVFFSFQLQIDSQPLNLQVTPIDMF